MATALQNYQTAYDLNSEQIVMLSAAMMSGPGDATNYTVEGVSITRKDFFARLDSLYAQQERLKRLMQMDGGSFEVHSYGTV